MKFFLRFFLIITAIIISDNIYANSDELTIINPWARATVAKQTASGIFLSIKSNKDLKLFKVESSLASKSEIHTMSIKNNTMYMHEIDFVNIPKDKITNLNGAYHLMLFGLKQKLQAGNQVPLILYFKDDKNSIIKHRINITVKPIYYSEK